MAYFFSPETGGFYDDQVNMALPADARSITPQAYTNLMEAIADGAQIAADSDGSPIAAAPPPLTAEQLLMRMRRERGQRLAACDYLMMPDYPATETERDAWGVYRQQLRDLPETITDPADIAWPEAPAGERN